MFLQGGPDCLSCIYAGRGPSGVRRRRPQASQVACYTCAPGTAGCGCTGAMGPLFEASDKTGISGGCWQCLEGAEEEEDYLPCFGPGWSTLPTLLGDVDDPPPPPPPPPVCINANAGLITDVAGTWTAAGSSSAEAGDWCHCADDPCVAAGFSWVERAEPEEDLPAPFRTHHCTCDGCSAGHGDEDVPSKAECTALNCQWNGPGVDVPAGAVAPTAGSFCPASGTSAPFFHYPARCAECCRVLVSPAPL